MMGQRSILGFACGLALIAAGLGVVSCADVPTSAECATACAVASRCGLLPSALGGTVGASRQHNEQDCIARCEVSDPSSSKVSGLLVALGARDGDDDGETARTILDFGTPPLCGPEGTDACENLIEQLQAEIETSELEVTTTLTLRMISTASHVTNASLSSWCCFDYAEDLDDDPAYPNSGQPSTNIDEIEELLELFEPTHDCLVAVRSGVDATRAAIRAVPPTPDPDTPNPDDPTPEELLALLEMVTMECDAIGPLWKPLPPEGEMTVPEEEDDCRFARMSSRLHPLMISELSCNTDDLQALDDTLSTLFSELNETMMAWNLQDGGLIVDGTGKVRDSATIHENAHARIRDELTRPRGFLEDACDDLLGDDGESGCDTLVPEDPDAVCIGGPACSAADCLDEDTKAPACDVSRCDTDSSPPGRECERLGITEIRLGYRTSRGLETFGEPITSCASLTEVATVFEDVKVGPLTPLAVVTGTLPTSLIPEDGASLGDGSFSWIVEGNTRWATAGHAELELPTPLLELLENGLENPLELLFGWVPRRLPTGKACDDEPTQCEGYFNDNCDNGIDDDGDGLIDEADAWCDCLFEELVARCVVVPPGVAPQPCCVNPSLPECSESRPRRCAYE